MFTTNNPMMSCYGCELWPQAAAIARAIAATLGETIAHQARLRGVLRSAFGKRLVSAAERIVFSYRLGDCAGKQCELMYPDIMIQNLPTP